MASERCRRGASAATLVTLLALITAAACQGKRPPDVIESASATSPPANEGSPSDQPSSDVQLETFALASRDELFDHLRDVGWAEAVVLPGAEPKQLELWEGDGHWHASTTYRFSGRRVSVTQAGFEGLPPGRLVRVRGDYGIRSQGGLYWIEREFTLAVFPGKKTIAFRLEWISLR